MEPAASAMASAAMLREDDTRRNGQCGNNCETEKEFRGDGAWHSSNLQLWTMRGTISGLP
jgi:hypothetical protein